MKLEIKHLENYLSHKLMCVRNGSNPVELVGLRFGNEAVNNELWIWKEGKQYLTGYLYECKPILRPLSDLTKEIEHNGQKFVPIYELCDVFNTSVCYSDYKTIKKSCKYTTSGSFLYTIWGNSNLIIKPTHKDETVFLFNININHITRSPYWMLEKLFEWHFDVFGLIKEGLALPLI